jgi:integrase
MTGRVKEIISARSFAPDGQRHPETAYVFGDPCGNPIKDIKTAWLGTCRRAKVSGLHFHDLRREAGSRLLEAGVPLHVVSVWLGHGSVSQTATYLAINLPQLHDARTRLEAAQQAVQDAARQATEERGQHDPACKDAANWLDSASASEIDSLASPTIH